MPWANSLSWPTLIAAGLAAYALTLQAVVVAVFIRAMRRAKRVDTSTRRTWPRIEVFMPIRGGGPGLGAALEYLMTIDYPNYHIRAVIDHPDDPAGPVFAAAQERFGAERLRYEFIRDHAPQRSLLCTGLVQFFEGLDPSTELIAICAADMNLPKCFLRDLATAMDDPKTGSTLGNRWYIPQADSWGSIVRYLWNAGAVVPMWAGRIPWGGASTFRPDQVRASGLLEAWKTSMVEDAPIKRCLDRLGLKFKSVAHLLVVNEDRIGIRDCYEFLTRQMLWTRLYHGTWPLVVIGTIFLTVAMFLPWLVAACQFYGGRRIDGLVAVGAAFGYWLGAGLLLAAIERTMRTIIVANGQPVRGITFPTALKVLLSIPITQALYMAATIRCTFMKAVRWSGIEYRILPGKKVRMVAYSPLRTKAVPASTSSPVEE